MASGNFISNTGTSLNLYVTWSSSTNISGNYSTVTINVYVRAYSLSVGSRSDSVMICNGETYTYTAPSISRGSGSSLGDTLIGSKSFIVYHNGDGTKSTTLEAKWRFSGSYSGVSIGWITCSAYVTLDSIPRAATINSAPDFVSSENPTITFSNPGGFSLNARMEFGGTSIQRNSISNSGSCTFSLTTAERNLLFSKCPNSNALSVRFVIATKIGSSSETHWSYIDRTMTVQSGNPSFTSISPTIINNSVPSAWGIYVQSKSQCRLNIIGASGIYGSSITGYSISGGGFSGTSSALTTGILNSSGTITFTARITDSRGRTASKTVSIYVYPYSSPRVTSVLSQRCVSNGTLNDDGTYIRCVASTSFSSCNSNNSVTRKVYFRQNDEDDWSSGINFSNGTAVVIGGGLIDVDYSYQVMYEITDAFTTVQLLDLVSTAFTTLDFKLGGRGVAVGKVAEHDNLFDVGLAVQMPLKIQCGTASVTTGGGTTPGNVTVTFPIVFPNVPIVTVTPTNLMDGLIMTVTYTTASTVVILARTSSATTVNFNWIAVAQDD